MFIKQTKIWFSVLTVTFVVGLLFDPCAKPLLAQEAKPILIGVPNPRGNINGRLADQGIILAAEKINAGGGINVGGVKRPVMLEILDTRDLDPGVPRRGASWN